MPNPEGPEEITPTEVLPEAYKEGQTQAFIEASNTVAHESASSHAELTAYLDMATSMIDDDPNMAKIYLAEAVKALNQALEREKHLAEALKSPDKVFREDVPGIRYVDVTPTLVPLNQRTKKEG